MIRRGLVVVVGTTAFCAALSPATGADPAASRIVDRTFVCGVKLRAGERRIEPSAWSGYRDPSEGPRWKWPPYADIGGRDLVAYVSIAAGSPPPAPDLRTHATTRWVSVDARPCNVSNARVALSPRGLEGGQASQFQHSDEYECSAPSQILIRLRAEFARPVTLRAQPLYGARYYATTSAAAAKKAAFAATTMTGRPLVYATVSETGKATLFTAKGCIPE